MSDKSSQTLETNSSCASISNISLPCTQSVDVSQYSLPCNSLPLDSQHSSISGYNLLGGGCGKFGNDCLGNQVQQLGQVPTSPDYPKSYAVSEQAFGARYFAGKTAGVQSPVQKGGGDGRDGDPSDAEPDSADEEHSSPRYDDYPDDKYDDNCPCDCDCDCDCEWGDGKCNCTPICDCDCDCDYKCPCECDCKDCDCACGDGKCVCTEDCKCSCECGTDYCIGCESGLDANETHTCGEGCAVRAGESVTDYRRRKADEEKEEEILTKKLLSGGDSNFEWDQVLYTEDDEQVASATLDSEKIGGENNTLKLDTIKNLLKQYYNQSTGSLVEGGGMPTLSLSKVKNLLGQYYNKQYAGAQSNRRPPITLSKAKNLLEQYYDKNQMGGGFFLGVENKRIGGLSEVVSYFDCNSPKIAPKNASEPVSPGFPNAQNGGDSSVDTNELFENFLRDNQSENSDQFGGTGEATLPDAHIGENSIFDPNMSNRKFGCRQPNWSPKCT